MPTANHPPIWRLRRGDSTVYILGGRPPQSEPWAAPIADQALSEAKEFWSEVPEVGPEGQSLAFRYGVDLARPLAKAVSPAVQQRASEAAVRLGVPPATLSPLRPWLTAQVLRSALNAKRTTDPDTAPEARYRKQALALKVPAFSEFPTTEDLLKHFAGLSPAAEGQFLELALDEFEEPEAVDAQRAAEWRAGTIEGEPARAQALSERYPAFYEELAVARNREWVPRIQRMLSEPGTVLMVVGLGHLVGPDSLLDMLNAAGIDSERV
jgi:uncharacterized protein